LKKNDLPEEWKKVWAPFLDLYSNKYKQKPNPVEKKYGTSES
jgi:hypothetical protein